MNKEFAVHMLNDEGRKKACRIAEIFDATLTDLTAFCPDSREMSIVRTKLEEASFFAKKSMAMQEENQQ